MNIWELNNKINGCQGQKQGDYASFIMNSIENKELEEMASKWNEVNKEIKF